MGGGGFMYQLERLIKESNNNHYKLLTLVGNEENKRDQIAEYLQAKGWVLYDVEEVVLNLVEDLPPAKIGVRLGGMLDEWIKERENRIVLTNTSILFSPELGQVNPVESFSYAMRGDKSAVLFLEARLRDDKAVYSTPDRDDYAVVDLSKVIYKGLSEVSIGGDE